MSSDERPLVKLGWRSTTSASAPSGAPRAFSQSSERGRGGDAAADVTSGEQAHRSVGPGEYRLYVFSLSRDATLSQWCDAIAVSRSKTRCARSGASVEAGQFEHPLQVREVRLADRGERVSSR